MAVVLLTPLADDDLADLLTQLCGDAFNSMTAHGSIVLRLTAADARLGRRVGVIA